MRYLSTLLVAYFCSVTFLSAQYWEQTNGPSGGTIADIVTVESRVWAGGSGGLFYSDDLGNIWHYSPIIPKDRFVRAVCTRNGILYVLSALPIVDSYDAIPLLHISSDNGNTWIERDISNSEVDPQYGFFCDMYFFRDQLIVADGDVFARSTDEGLTWHQIVFPEFANSDYMQGTKTHLLLTNYEYPDTLYFSEDIEDPWQVIELGFIDSAFHTSIRALDKVIFLTAYYSGSAPDKNWYSKDNGASWQPLAIGGGNSAFFIQGQQDTIFAIDEDQLWVSTDTCASWQLFSNVDPKSFIWTFANNQIVGITEGGRGISKFDRLNNVWKDCNNGVNNRNIAFLSSNDTVLIASSNNKYYSSSNSGEGWSVSTGTFSVPSSSFYTKGDSIFYVSNGKLMFSIDDGSTFLVFSSLNGTPKNTVFIGNLAIAIYISDIIVISLESAIDFTIPTLGTAFRDNQICVSGSTLFYYDDDDATVWTAPLIENAIWTQVFDPNHNAGVPSCALLVANDFVYYFFENQIYITGNGGLTWFDIYSGGLPEDYGSFYDPVKLIKEGNELWLLLDRVGIYRSQDDGVNWTEMNNGLDNLPRRVTDLIKHNGVMYLSTSTAGVWKYNPGSSVQQPNEIEKVILMPNPTSGLVTLPHQPDQVVVTDQLGKIVYTNKRPTSQVLHLTGLSDGLYYVQYAYDGKKFVGKVVIKH
jgi:hypothetical protein